MIKLLFGLLFIFTVNGERLYDGSPFLMSPSGRVYQMEYAIKV